MMTNDEIERAIEFIVNQKGQFSSDMQRLEQNLSTVERNLGTTVNILSELTKTQLRMAESEILRDNRIAELAAAQKRTDEALAGTDDRLNSLIVVVERYFSNGRRDN
jgi:prefoldin subunit 5